MLDAAPIHPSQVASLSDSEVRELAVKLLARVERDAREIVSRDAKIEKLAYEVAHLRRLKFGVKSEQLNAQQKALFEEALDADIAALEARLNDLKAPPKGGESCSRPKRTALPPNLPSREIAHEPESTTCACGSALERIGEDVSQKLDYTPGVFTAERHVRGKWPAQFRLCSADQLNTGTNTATVAGCVHAPLRQDRTNITTGRSSLRCSHSSPVAVA